MKSKKVQGCMKRSKNMVKKWEQNSIKKGNISFGEDLLI